MSNCLSSWHMNFRSESLCCSVLSVGKSQFSISKSSYIIYEWLTYTISMLNSQRVTLSIFARKNASIQQTWVIIFCWNSIWKKIGGWKDGTILVPHNSYGNFGTHVHIHIVLLASHISPGWSVPKFQPQIWKTLEKMRELRNIQNGNMVISYDMICFFLGNIKWFPEDVLNLEFAKCL